jgi:hypothetical protein
VKPHSYSQNRVAAPDSVLPVLIAGGDCYFGAMVNSFIHVIMYRCAQNNRQIFAASTFWTAILRSFSGALVVLAAII